MVILGNILKFKSATVILNRVDHCFELKLLISSNDSTNLNRKIINLPDELPNINPPKKDITTPFSTKIKELDIVIGIKELEINILTEDYLKIGVFKQEY